MLHCQARGRIAAAQLRIPAGALVSPERSPGPTFIRLCGFALPTGSTSAGPLISVSQYESWAIRCSSPPGRRQQLRRCLGDEASHQMIGNRNVP